MAPRKLTKKQRAAQCSVPGCPKTGGTYANGWCPMHYQRFTRTGSLDLAPRLTQDERFWQKVERTDSCWLWLGAKNDKGYGQLCRTGARNGEPARLIYAHRVSYELMIGLIPEGLVIDHLCRNASCVNPAHLEAVTFTENVRRGLIARRALVEVDA